MFRVEVWEAIMVVTDDQVSTMDRVFIHQCQVLLMPKLQIAFLKT